VDKIFNIKQPTISFVPDTPAHNYDHFHCKWFSYRPFNPVTPPNKTTGLEVLPHYKTINKDKRNIAIRLKRAE
jgi:hypothetical protein